MRQRVARNDQPLPAAEVVMPPLAMRAVRILALEHVAFPVGARGIERRYWRDFAAVRELGLIAWAAERAAKEQHQCHWGVGPAPFSSMALPSPKRSSVKARLSACGASCAIVCANTR